MQKKGKQNQALIPKTGSMNQSKDGGNEKILYELDRNGIIDIMQLKSKPQKVNLIQQGRCFSSIDQLGSLTLFHYDKNRYIDITVPSPAVYSIQVDRNEGNLVVALKSNSILIFSILNGKLLRTLKPHDFHIITLDVNYQRNEMLSVSQDECIIWDLGSYDRKKSLFAKSSKFSSACFSIRGEELITIFEDKTVCIWSLSSFEVISKVDLTESCMKTQLCKDVQNSRILINTYSTSISFLDNSNLITSLYIPPGYGGVQQIVASNYIFILTKTSQILLINQNRIISQVVLPLGQAAVSIDTQGNRLLVALDNKQVVLYDAKIINDAQQNLDDSRLKQGIEKDLVYTYLKQSTQFKENFPINLSEVDQSQVVDIKKIGFNASQSSVNQNTSNKKNQLRQSNIVEHQKPYNTHNLSKEFKKSGQDPFSTLMSNYKLNNFLKHYGLFPDKQRSLAWRALLSLPMNNNAYQDLCSLGIHPAYKNLRDKYPVQQDSLLSRLQRTLSCLAHYCPLYAEVDYLPEFVFPFVKLFQRGEEHLLFEVVLAFLVQHCQKFFEYFPNAPVGVLQLHDQLLQKHDPELYSHLKLLGYSAVQHVWPSLKCVFTDVLGKDQWLRVIDHLIAFNSQPQLLLLLSVSYYQYFRNTFLHMQSTEQFIQFLSRQNPIDPEKLIKRSLELLESSDSSKFCITYTNNLPLLKDQYQIFSVYPKHQVEYQQNSRNQILEDQIRIQKRQQNANQLNQMADQMFTTEEQFKERQYQLVQANKDRAEMMDYEMEMRMSKQQKVEQEIRDKRLNYVQKVEDLLHTTVTNQDQIRRQEDEHLFEQLQKQKQFDNQQILVRKEEEALLDLEFKAFQRFQDLVLVRSQEEKARQIQQEIEFKNRQNQIQSQAKFEQWRTEEQENRLKQELQRNQYIQQMQGLQDHNDRARAQQELVIGQMSEELKMLHFERDKRLREVTSSEVAKLEQFAALISQKEAALQQQENLLMNKQAQQLQQSMPQTALRDEDMKAQLQYNQYAQQEELVKERQRLAEIQSMNRREEFQQKVNEIDNASKRRAQDDQKRLNQFMAQTEEENNRQDQQRAQLYQREQEIEKRQEQYNRRDKREYQAQENNTDDFENFRQQLHQQRSRKQLDREQSSSDQEILQQMRDREKSILEQSQNLRNQIQEEVYQTGQFNRRPNQYEDNSFSPQLDDDNIISNQSDLSSNSSKNYYR